MAKDGSDDGEIRSPEEAAGRAGSRNGQHLRMQALSLVPVDGGQAARMWDMEQGQCASMATLGCRHWLDQPLP